MIEETQKTRGFMDWLKESASVKIGFIGLLIIVLLIPSTWIQGLIVERTNRQKEVLDEVSDSWSGSQLIKGPVLVIPYKKTEKYLDTAQKAAYREISDNLYILPNTLNYKAAIKSQKLHRGIFDVVVYNSQVKVSGNFEKINLTGLNVTADQLLFDKAKLVFEISDLKGLKNNPVIKAGDQTLTAEPSLSNSGLFKNGLQANVNMIALAGNQFTFAYTLELKGSNDLHFLHLGKATDVYASGDWASPSFDGRYIPDSRETNDKGFWAKWHMLYYNRPFPQQWIGDNNLLDNEKALENATFGVVLKLPVDQYQKTMRTSKYAILITLLTFISLFLTEVISKQRIHSFNYILIGAAMIIYYVLLLSFSEQIGFNLAYMIASISTIVLVAIFIASLLRNKKSAILFSVILTIFYTFIFVIIQLEDFALMVGSIALFIIVATLMFVSRKINWDNQ